MQSVIDHLVVTGATLETATAHVEETLGVATVAGGQHPKMGTHNRLLSLGADSYLEALAPDPGAQPPARPRWFGLDSHTATPQTAPRLAAWALRVPDFDAALAQAPDGIGPAHAMTRGVYDWRITIPDDGQQPFDGVFPALIAWNGQDPAAALPETGARLVSLTLRHPDAGRLGWALSMLTSDDRVTVHAGPPGLTALIVTDEGERELA